MAITYPVILPPQGIRSISIRPRNAVAMAKSPFTGQQQVQAHQGQWWEADVEFPPMKQSGYADDMAAFIASLRGKYGTFLLGDSSRKTARGVAALARANDPASTLVNGASQSGHVLNTDGWPNSTNVFRAGDYIQIGGENILTRSSEFGHANWVKTDCTVADNAISGPDGTTTAESLTSGTSGDSSALQYFGVANAGSSYAAGVWLKADAGTPTVTIRLADGLNSNAVTSCVLSTSEWRFFYATGKLSVSSFFIISIPASTKVFAWGAQANIGHTPDPYYPTSSSGTSSTRRIHKLVSDCWSNGSGQASLDIWPRLRSSPADNERIKVGYCQGTFRLASNDYGWSVDPSKIYSAGFTAVEDLSI